MEEKLIGGPNVWFVGIDRNRKGKTPFILVHFLMLMIKEILQLKKLPPEKAVQNSLDAGKNVHKITRLEFHKLSISGEKKSKLLKLFEFEELLRPRLETFKKNERTKFFAANVRQIPGPRNL